MIEEVAAVFVDSVTICRFSGDYRFCSLRFLRMKRATRATTAINPATKHAIRDANDGASDSMFQSVAKAPKKRNMKTRVIKINRGERVEPYLRKPGAKMFFSAVSPSNEFRTEPQTKTGGLRASMVMVGPASISIVHSKTKTGNKS
jgi:hypothetical protein